jgi:thymidylate kinase
MALVCIGGLDRTGKTSVAELYRSKGFTVVHLSAPDKKYFDPSYRGPSYFEDYIDMLMSFGSKDVVMDRFWDGELIWPQVYGRTPMLSEQEIDQIREIEMGMGASYILMHDPDYENHWKRCVENNEPLTKPQFVKARSLYYSIAEKYNFTKATIRNFFPNMEDDKTKNEAEKSMSHELVAANPVNHVPVELQKLELANAINDVLSKRVIKAKGDIYDSLESDVRDFLLGKLGNIFGEDKGSSFTKDEVKMLKLLCKRFEVKENKK